jgi:hypothetical protein
MGRLIAVDPGKHTGIAVFEGNRLRNIFLITNDSLQLYIQDLVLICAGLPPDRAVIEMPKIYDRKQWKGDPNDLMKVAFLAGIIHRSLFGTKEIKWVHPSDWKGQRPKNVDNKYTLTLLTPDELKIIDNSKIAKSKMHNVLDAVGIGLWKLGRR